MPKNVLLKFLVEYDNTNGTMSARFTDEKQAKQFYKRQKKEVSVSNVKLFSLNSLKQKDKEIKCK